MPNEFRYYRWRTVYGKRLWSLDAEFYVLLGSLFMLDVAAQAERDHVANLHKQSQEGAVYARK